MGFGIFQSNRQRRRQTYKALLREALHGIHTVVDRDAQIDSIGIVLSLSDNEDVWIDMVVCMVDMLKDDHPMSSVLICFLLDTFSLPTLEMLMMLNQKLIKRAKRSSLTASQARNIAVVWSIFAEKFAGQMSREIFQEPCVKALMRMLQDAKRPIVQLHALLALEKFALTAENKEIILSQPEFLPTLRQLEMAPDDQDPVRHQARFAARWSLDNMFPSPNRDYGTDPRRSMAINVMLNKSDQTDFLKLSRHGLEARNDSDSFESVRGTVAVTSGAWYYEVMVYTAGILQIGWATKHCLFESEEGGGVGDDANSLAFDGCRRRVWHRGTSVEYGTRAWKPGDVVGVYLDMDHNTLSYALNGEDFGNVMSLLDPPVNFNNIVASDSGFYPAVSMIVHQHCAINFGDRPFRYQPHPGYKTLNSIGVLSPEERFIVPRLALRNQVVLSNNDDPTPKCQICCDRPQGCMLIPCRHKGFCAVCAIQVEQCPICRTNIEERVEAPPPTPPPYLSAKAAAGSVGSVEGRGMPINSDSVRNSSRRSHNSASTRSLWLGTINTRRSSVIGGGGSLSPSPGNTLQHNPRNHPPLPEFAPPSGPARPRPSPISTLASRSESSLPVGVVRSGPPTPPLTGPPNRTPPSSWSQKERPE